MVRFFILCPPNPMRIRCFPQMPQAEKTRTPVSGGSRRHPAASGTGTDFGSGIGRIPPAGDPYFSFSTAMPGSSLPSRNSREAPPPVEMCVILSAKPSLVTAATESPPPIIETAPVSATA